VVNQPVVLNESASHNKASPALSTEGGEEGKGRVSFLAFCRSRSHSRRVRVPRRNAIL